MPRDVMRHERRRRTATIVIAVLAVPVLVFAAFLVLRPTPPPPPGPEIEFESQSDPDAPRTGKVGADLGAALEKLDDPSRPFNILLVGDSTGVDDRGWQVRLMTWLSETTSRPWTLHQWNQNPEVAPVGYFDPPWNYGGGENAPLVLWNGSAGGRDFSYTVEHGDEMVPADLESVDLMLVNHGHNVSPPASYYNVGIPFIEEIADRYPEMAVVVMAQNPEKGARLNVSELDAVLDYVRTFAKERSVPMVDVYKAFNDTGRPESLIDKTNFHPTKPGYQMWFELVRDVLVEANPALGPISS